MFIIDPPTPFDPPAAWRAHLRSMRRLIRKHPGDADLQAAIREAEAHLAALK